jgi:[acyl-carrier-protein] S-malonyltransferase
VQAIAKSGATHVIECGPGKVLAGLTKRIDGNLAGTSITDPASLGEVLKLVTA